MPGSMSKQEIELRMTELGVVGCKSPRAKQDDSGCEPDFAILGSLCRSCMHLTVSALLAPRLCVVCGALGTRGPLSGVGWSERPLTRVDARAA